MVLAYGNSSPIYVLKQLNLKKNALHKNKIK